MAIDWISFLAGFGAALIVSVIVTAFVLRMVASDEEPIDERRELRKGNR
jgi:hypothetical protein